jgi:hypothetical protein
MIRRVIVLAIALVLLSSSVASATFTKQKGVAANSFGAATLAPGTGLSAVNAGANGITLTWTASTSNFEDGYEILRGTVSGGPYTEVATTGLVLTYTDPVPVGTYFYVVRATGGNWTSINSAQASATSTMSNTGFLVCSANSPVTSGSGDNDGFDSNPAAACANGATTARDTSTGFQLLFPPDSCTGAFKDRHIFNGFGATPVPTGKTVDGIEIRAALSQSNTQGTTRVCAELSWNGGTSWTTPDSVLLTQTAEQTFTFGATNDKWGRTWTPNDFTNGNFRLRITDSSNVLLGNKDIMLRNLGLRVTYH